MAQAERFKKGLILIPTPLEESLPLEPVALELLHLASSDPNALILVEEHKVARNRWIKWGLPRERIDSFVIFNEHTAKSEEKRILEWLRAGKRVFVMSDGGLPAFCDPGMELVNLCHNAGISVTASPFPNSIALALALSGFDHREFHFSGFLPAEAGERKKSLASIAQKYACTVVLMDTPYRLQSLLKDLVDSPLKNRNLFIATSLNSDSERLYRGKPQALLSEIGSLNKVEFMMVLE